MCLCMCVLTGAGVAAAEIITAAEAAAAAERLPIGLQVCVRVLECCQRVLCVGYD